MSRPRMCLPNTTYLVTQTVLGRKLLLTPCPIVNQVLLYCAFRAAKRTGVEIHWVAVEANHLHMGVTDRDGNISKFMQIMDRLIALCLMAHYRKTHPQEHLEGIWSKGQFSAVALLNREAVLDKFVYSLTNCVKDGLVPDYRKWPGLCSRPSDWLRGVRHAERPKLFFNQKNTVWATVPYQFTVPPALRDRTPELLVEDAEALIREKQWALQAEHKDKGFRGVKAVLNADPFGSPNSPRPRGLTNPTVAAGGDTELLRAALRLVRSFRERYREALKRYRNGVLDALFPAGTLKMRLLHHARCDVLDAPWCTPATVPT